MQCPRCKTNLYGNLNKCTVCGYIIQNSPIQEQKKEQGSNGILDPKNFEQYTKNLELYKRKNKEPNIMIPIIFILLVVVILILVALIKFII